MKHNYRWILNLSVLICVVLAIAVTTIGVLVTPVIMSIMFTWYWMFLYVGYLAIMLCVALYYGQNCVGRHEGGTRK